MVRRQSGFGLLFALFLIALVSISLTAAELLKSTETKIEKEAQLLFVGDQYRQAIQGYYLNSPGSPHFPPDIQALLQDPRYPNIVRHLREAYRDPMTGKPFLLIRDPQSKGIAGVYSGAQGTPVKTAGFSQADRSFTGSESYFGWRFEFALNAPPPGKNTFAE